MGWWTLPVECPREGLCSKAGWWGRLRQGTRADVCVVGVTGISYTDVITKKMNVLTMCCAHACRLKAAVH